MNEVSNLFVCLMGMGTTFVGLICIIFLTMLMGKAILAALQQEPGFDLARVSSIDIRRI